MRPSAIAFFLSTPYSRAWSTTSSPAIASGNVEPLCGTYPIRRRTPTGSFARSHPATVAVPLVGVIRVASIRIVVVLPSPVRAEEADDLPVGHIQVYPLHGLHRPTLGLEGADKPASFDHHAPSLKQSTLNSQH